MGFLSGITDAVFGSPSSSKSTSESGPWGPSEPYLEAGFEQAVKNYNNPADFYPGATYTPFAPQTEMGLDMLTDRATYGSPVANAAQGYATNVLGGGTNTDTSRGFSTMNDFAASPQFQSIGASGQAGSVTGSGGAIGVGPVGNARDVNQSGVGYNTLADTAQGNYLNANPYLDAMFGAASENVTNRFNDTVTPSINATFGSGGRTGSGIHALTMANAQDKLGDDLTSMASNIYGNNYQSERGRQTTAGNQLNQGSLQSQQANQGMDDRARSLQMQGDISTQQASTAAAGQSLQADIANQNTQNAALDRDFNAQQQNQSAFSDALNRQATAGTNLMSQYNTDQNRQMSAMNYAPTAASMDYQDINGMLKAGDITTGKAQEILNDDMARYNYYQNQPDENLQNYMNLVGAYDTQSASTRSTGADSGLFGSITQGIGNMG